MDYSQMTDEQLDAEINKVKGTDYSSMTDEQLDALISHELSQSPLETFARHGANAAVLGYEPQIEGGVKALAQGVQNGQMPTKDSYIQNRDKAVLALTSGAKQNPIAATTGALTGSIAPMLVAPEVAAADAPAMIKGLVGTATGLTQMAAQNPGDVKGEINPLQLPERAQNMQDPIGLALSATPLAMHSIGGIVKGLSEINPAYKSAFLATGPSAKKFREAVSLDPESTKSMENIGKFAIDKGLVQAGDKVDNVYFKASDMLKKLGSDIGDFYDRNQNKIEDYLKTLSDQGNHTEIQKVVDNTFNIQQQKPAIMSNLENMIGAREGSDNVLQRVSDHLDNLTQKYGENPDIGDLHKIKVALGEDVKDWGKAQSESLPMQNAFRYLNGVFGQAIEGEIQNFSKVLAPDELQKLKTLNKDYSLTSEIQDNALKSYSKKEVGSHFGNTLGALGGMLGYAAYHDPTMALMTGAAGKAIGAVGENVAPRMQATTAVMQNSLLNSQPKALLAPLRGYLGQTAQPQDYIEDFPKNMTRQVPAEQIFMMQNEISKDSNLDNVAKAKRMNLLNKHGLMYLGQ